MLWLSHEATVNERKREGQRDKERRRTRRKKRGLLALTLRPAPSSASSIPSSSQVPYIFHNTAPRWTAAAN